jgi:hypothetical protein
LILVSGHDWRRAKDIFGEVLDLPAEGRARFLDAACAGNAELRARVEGLLASHGAADESFGGGRRVQGDDHPER